MRLPQLAHAIRKELSVRESKQAAKEFGLSYFYFTQKIKAVDTNSKDLFNAVRCLLKVHKDRNSRIQKLYDDFLTEYKKVEDGNF